MISSTAPTETLSLQAAAIADAATRLACLQRLADLGMRLAEEICERAINSPYHPEPAHEPARAFATVSRAVRLTLVLHEKMQAKLIALRNGAAPPADESPVARGTCENRANTNGAAVDDACDDAPEPTDRSRETLREVESERFEDLVSGAFDDCVAAIRSDLGLEAEGDIPSDKEGAETARGRVRETATVTAEVDEASGVGASATPMAASAPHPTDSG